MQQFFDILPEKHNTAIALGFFDGLHKGHRNVISSAVKQKANGLLPVCFTFAQSPKSVLKGRSACALMTEADKDETLWKLGIKHIYKSDFRKIMNMSAYEFFTDILIKTLNAKMLFCGFNYHFGKNGEGNVEILKELCNNASIKLEVLPPVEADGMVISSTLIRNLIKDGNISAANKMLCGRFGFSSKIEHGKQLGRDLGTPTINQPPCPELVVPKFGVYASCVTLENNKKYCGVTNIGIKPTVGGNHLLCETWMPEYNGEEIYGQTADIRLIDFIRPEKKFENITELKNAIKDNGKTALQIFYSEFN